MAIRKATAASAGNDDDAGTGAAPGVDETQSPGEVTKGGKPEAKPNEELVGLFVDYDENVEKAESSFIKMVEFIQTNEVDRATVVLSMMKARKCTYETAQSQYSRMKKILNNEEVLNDLKNGNITLKVAREKTAAKQKNPTSAKPEAKEARFTNTLKAFVAAAKESGFSLKEVMVSVEAELKSAQIK